MDDGSDYDSKRGGRFSLDTKKMKDEIILQGNKGEVRKRGRNFVAYI